MSENKDKPVTLGVKVVDAVLIAIFVAMSIAVCAWVWILSA